jgi:hypothetical protein
LFKKKKNYLGPTQSSVREVPGVMRPRREADYSLPRNTEVKDELKYTFTASYVFMAWYLVKHTDKFMLP